MSIRGISQEEFRIVWRLFYFNHITVSIFPYFGTATLLQVYMHHHIWWESTHSPSYTWSSESFTFCLLLMAFNGLKLSAATVDLERLRWRISVNTTQQSLIQLRGSSLSLLMEFWFAIVVRSGKCSFFELLRWRISVNTTQQSVIQLMDSSLFAIVANFGKCSFRWARKASNV